MKKLFIISLLCILCGAAQAQKIKIKTGIEVLKEQNFKCLEGKRVGLITNPTGVDNQLKSTIDILHEAPNVNLVALYGPEHGVRGDVHAGDHVTDMKDVATGLPVYSLYGKTRKATPEMLNRLSSFGTSPLQGEASFARLKQAHPLGAPLEGELAPPQAVTEGGDPENHQPIIRRNNDYGSGKTHYLCRALL